ncbi:DUF5672 family protein [uncultured Selenomonas sp.]|uniref:DUF5672 family protein n=1 Tax=uncultured Selenomonas sp. TaxID=159275 RepID=UPI0025FDD221|nr:DUF5672 family protein [uncultured Selenomonas sp.]
MKQEVVIVVPMYRVDMDAFERISWEQLHRVLGAYPICIVAPASIVEALRARYGVAVEGFSDEHFRNVQSYSRMMLDAGFYRRFQAYEYMLVYQLDAFVFSDQLHRFCSMGYDYIGAPWPVWMQREAFFRPYRVGNGGFSLRRISAALRVLQRKAAIIKDLPTDVWRRCEDSEDVFWAYCTSIASLQFSIPSPREAYAFSMEWFSRKLRLPEALPFGCHGWSNIGYRDWRDVIASYGYSLPKAHGRSMRDIRKMIVQSYILDRLLKSAQKKGVLHAAFAQIPSSRNLVLWGWGKEGHKMQALLTLAGYEITMILDRGQEGATTEAGIPVQRPILDGMKKGDAYIIVATLRYEDEICRELDEHGLRKGQDYASMSELLRQICQTYVYNLRKKV